MRALLLLLFAAVAQCRLAPFLKVEPNIPGQYNVVLEDDVNVADFAATMKNGIVRKTIQGIINAVVLTLDDDLLQQIRGLDGVKYIEEDGLITLAGEREVRNFWGLDRIDQRNLPLDNKMTIDGEGSWANIYVLDTGINYDHQDFGRRAKLFYDYENGDGRDCHGHGTHCAGTAGGKTCGVAANANIYSARVMTCNGYGAGSASIDALNAVADLTGVSNRVASMSIGGGYSKFYNDAVAGAVAKGVVVVAAAGNDNRNACSYSPASAPEAITVGATTSRDQRSFFSNYGTCLDIFAPGSNIRSASYRFDNQYLAMSGTSMACPHVSGAAAVVLGNGSGLKPSQVADKLTSDCTKNVVGDPGTGSPNCLLYLD